MTSLTMSKRLAVGFLLVLAMLAVVAGIYYTWLITPPGMPETPEDALSTIASARYERLPDYRKQDYLDRTAELMQTMPDEQRRDLFRKMRTDEDVRQALREVREDQTVKRVREWAEADPKARKKLIDETIREQEEMRKRFEEWRQQRAEERASEASRPEGERRSEGERRADGERRPDGERRRGNPREHIQRRIEEGNPQMMAWRMEMREAINERRKELGLSEPPGPPGRGPR
jgi:hypothetical protein